MRRLQELMDMTGRNAVVAGGAGNVGRAAVDALTELGARVAVIDRDELEGIASFAADLADPGAARAAVDAAAAELGGIDVLVHSAALVGTSELEGWAEPFERQSVDAWEAALRVNLTSAFVLAQHAAPALAARGKGALVFVSSIYGLVAPDGTLYEGTTMANPVAYGASKGGLLQLVRYLATELAPRVRVNAVSPGGIERGQPEAFLTRYRARTPLGRLATEEDVKGAIAYLASDLSAYVTGANIVVDGGWTTW
jgi:NAD(P)-dependent dehydrogenase (short-subunit alcohol dehydrogenase family)